MSLAISSRVSGPYEVPAHSLSAPQTAMFNADEPAMPAPAGDSPRVVSVRPRTPKWWARRPSSGSVGSVRRSSPGRQQHLACGVFGHEGDAIVGPALEAHVGAKADRGVQCLCAGVEQVERPDVDGAAGEINPCRRRRRDVHGAIIILQTHATDHATRHRPASDRQLPRRHDSRRTALAGARVRPGRRHPVQPQHRGARTGERARGRRRGAWPQHAGAG